MNRRNLLSGLLAGAMLGLARPLSALVYGAECDPFICVEMWENPDPPVYRGSRRNPWTVLVDESAPERPLTMKALHDYIDKLE